MPFVALEDVGTTCRRTLSGRRRLQAWERTGGTCVVCDRRIDGVRERWIVEHIRALELGGVDDIDNMGPAHEACGREKTRDDHARTARAKRQKIRHLGADVVVRPLPGSRACALKRKINGTVVLRRDEAALRPRSDPKLRAGQGNGITRSPPPLPMGILVEPGNWLCAHPTLSVKENGAGTIDPMANPATTAKLEAADGTEEDAAASGQILPAIPAHLDFLFADRPLLPGESGEQYDALLGRIIHQVKPADVIEAIWVKDVVDLIWEAKRLRRWRGQILVQAQLKAVAELVLQDFRNANFLGVHEVGGPSADALAAGWMTGSKNEKGRVDKILQQRGLTAADVMAQGFLMNLLAVERIDRLASSADQRRDALLREIERKRASFAQHVRSAVANVLDVEPTEAR